MAPIQFTVRGEASARRQPQRATVSLTVTLEGDKAPAVHAGVTGSLEKVMASIAELHDPDAGPITWFAHSQLRTWSTRPWHQQGKRLPVVHHASAPVRARFIDFEALGEWIGRVIEVPGVVVDGVEWALAEEDEERLMAHVRADAVRDAMAKAQQYADALDLGTVHPTHVADAGMLGGSGGNEHQPVAFAARSAMAGGAPELSFAPEEIVLRAVVDGRFATD